MENITQELANFVATAKFEDLPEAVVHESKRILLDAIGCALGGSTTDKGKISVGLARKLGGPCEATIIGVGGKVSPANAAFANGELINALDMDAILFPGHVSPFVIPAPLALAESSGASGKDLILAIGLAHEIATRMGRCLRGVRRYVKEKGDMDLADVHGYSASIFGGVSGAGRILGFDRGKMSHALGIAGHIAPVPTFTKWSRTAPTSAMTKYLCAGWVSQGEVTAALLADMGYIGDTTVLDGDYGFWRMFGSDKWQPNRLMENIGKEWHFLEISYKPYPCCRCMHGALDLFVDIIEENNLVPQDIEEVKVLLDPLTDELAWRNTGLVTHIDAQFRVPYVFAVAAHRIKPGADWQDFNTMRDPGVLEFMKKVSYDSHPEFNKSMLQDERKILNSVEVIAKGRTFEKEKTWAKGDPFLEEAKMKDEELIEKFRNNASRILTWDKMDKLITSTFGLEKVEDVSEFVKYAA